MTEPSPSAVHQIGLDASRYDVTVDPERESSSHALQLRLVGSSQHVLEIGCSRGHMTRALRDQGCRVIGLEGDREAAACNTDAEEVVVVDLDQEDFLPMLRGAKFDVALLGDVLEHLRDPLVTLRRARDALAPGGFMVISAPNVAHVDVRLALLEGRFDYRDVGLLDRTHLHFFTRDSLEQLVHDAGLLPVEEHRIVVELFCTEIGAPTDMPREVIDLALRDPEALTYQFVIKAVRDDGEHATRQLAHRCRELEDALHERHREALVAARQIASAEQRMVDLEVEIAALRAGLDDARRDSAAIRASRTFRLASVIGRLGRGLGPRREP